MKQVMQTLALILMGVVIFNTKQVHAGPVPTFVKVQDTASSPVVSSQEGYPSANQQKINHVAVNDLFLTDQEQKKFDETNKILKSRKESLYWLKWILIGSFVLIVVFFLVTRFFGDNTVPEDATWFGRFTDRGEDD